MSCSMEFDWNRKHDTQQKILDFKKRKKSAVFSIENNVKRNIVG